MSNEIKPKLSVLIPTYNRQEFISQAIDSVLNQSFSNFEIICSDNASSDGTFDILRDYQKKDSRIKVFQNQTNLGPVLNWKNCLDNANGKYIHWLWSDDWIEPNFYEDAFDLMKRDKTSLVSTWNYRFESLGNQNKKYVSWRFSFPFVPGDVASKKVLFLTKELPVSPAAYILPIKDVKDNFFTDIPEFDDLRPVAKGVGVDSLMVAGCCLKQDKISILQIPSVNFRKHENISTVLSKNGSLMKMYYISHLFFINKKGIKFTLYDYFRFLKRTLWVFKKDILSVKNLRFIIKGFPLNSKSDNFLKFSDGYNSEKVSL